MDVIIRDHPDYAFYAESLKTHLYFLDEWSGSIEASPIWNEGPGAELYRVIELKIYSLEHTIASGSPSLGIAGQRLFDSHFGDNIIDKILLIEPEGVFECILDMLVTF